jgi:shikimate kinase
MGSYWKIVKPAKGMVIVLTDTPENIVERLTFYDDESRLVERVLSSDEKRQYVREVRGDMSYFGRTYKRADLSVDIAGLSPGEAAAKVDAVLSDTRMM